MDMSATSQSAETLVKGWIDVHAHFSPPDDDAGRARRLQRLRASCWQLDEAPTWSARSTLAYLDRTGIQLQLLSNIPFTVDELRRSNEFGADVVRTHPDRFGLLAALPTDDPEACLAECRYASEELNADGYAVTALYNGVALSDPSLEPVWAELDRRGATVFCHPDAYQTTDGRPDAVFEVAFQTARVLVNMLYRGIFRRYPAIRFVIAHCGGALPAISGRLQLLGLERWVPNPERVTPAELREHLRRLYLDTAGTAPTGLAAALAMTSANHIVYGSDCGVPCSTDATMDANLRAVLDYDGLTPDQREGIGRRALTLFPTVAERIVRSSG